MRRRPNGYWRDIENVRRELVPIITELGRFPTHAEIKERVSKGFGAAITRHHGGWVRLRERLGYPADRYPDGYWNDFANVERALQGAIQRFGHFPNRKELDEIGLSGLDTIMEQKYGGTRAVRERLGHPSTKPKNGDRSDWELAKNELLNIKREISHFPTQAEIVERRGNGLVIAIQRYHGGLDEARRRLGDNIRSRDFFRSFDNLADTLRPIIAELGRFPSNPELRERGVGGAANAMSRHHGGIHAVRNMLGMPSEQRPAGHWNAWDHVEQAVRELADRLGHFPAKSDLDRAGLGCLDQIVRDRHGGWSLVRTRMGFDQRSERPSGYWRNWTHVEREILGFVEREGRFPTHADLIKGQMRTVSTAIVKYHGGYPSVRHRMGYGPVTDETVAAHADALTAIIPALGRNPADLWHRMKRSWTTRDLDAAISAHATTGSLDAFRRLLDGPAIPPRD